MQVFRTRAIQHEEPAKIVIANYSGPIMQLIADLIFFNAQFSMQQALGIAITLGASFIRCGYGIKKTFYT
jgi:drug/metabolite transporter (DMT)-like permease